MLEYEQRVITRYGMPASSGKARERRNKNRYSEVSLKPRASSEKPEDQKLETSNSARYREGGQGGENTGDREGGVLPMSEVQATETSLW